MVEEEGLPWPSEWRRHLPRAWLVVGLVTAGLVILLAVGVELAHGSYLPAAIAGLVALVLAPMVLHSWSKSSPTPARAVQVGIAGREVSGVRFGVRPISPLLSVGLAASGVAFLALAIGALVISVVRGQARLLVGFLVLAAVGVVLLLGGIAGLVQSRRNLGVDLTCEHIVVGLGGDRLVVAWDDLSEISATSVRYGMSWWLRPVQNWILAVTPDPGSVPATKQRADSVLGRLSVRVSGNVVFAVPDTRLLSEPALVYHALRHYLAHSEDRSELAADDAADALRSRVLAALRRTDPGAGVRRGAVTSPRL